MGQIISVVLVGADHRGGGVDDDDLAAVALQEPAVLLDVLGGAVEDAIEEAVVAAARAGADGAAGRIGHFDGLAQPAGHAAVGAHPARTALAAEVPPAAVAEHTLAHGWTNIILMVLYLIIHYHLSNTQKESFVNTLIPLYYTRSDTQEILQPHAPRTLQAVPLAAVAGAVGVPAQGRHDALALLVLEVPLYALYALPLLIRRRAQDRCLLAFLLLHVVALQAFPAGQWVGLAGLQAVVQMDVLVGQAVAVAQLVPVVAAQAGPNRRVEGLALSIDLQAVPG